MTDKEAIEILKPLTEIKINENGISTLPVVSTPLQVEALEIAIKALEERPQGEWTNTSPYDDTGECSLCCYLSKKYYKFCPNCDAKMKGGAE